MRNIKCSTLLICLLIMFCAAAPAYSQKFWEKKPFQEWSLKEALQLLTDSPWARTSDFLMEKYSTKLGAELDDPYPSFSSNSVRLRSALPIRQAFVRQKQISIKYDKLNAADKAKFDVEVKEFLECPPCAKYYIVTISSRVLKIFLKMGRKELSLDALQSRTFLANDRDEWRPCVHAREENEEILFFFPRLDKQNRALVTSGAKEFYFTMSGKVVEGKISMARAGAFTVSTLTQNGEIAF